MTRPLCGIFVGGAARRMAGFPKGLLPVGSQRLSIVDSLANLASSLGCEVVLVGDNPAYRALSLPVLADDPPGTGPLGGLRALLSASSAEPVLALGCDMPFVSKAVLCRLLAVDLRDADLAAAKTNPDAKLETFLARYAPSVKPHLDRALSDGQLGLQKVWQTLRVKTVLLDESEQQAAKDWDAWDDVPDDVKALLHLDQTGGPTRT